MRKLIYILSTAVALVVLSCTTEPQVAPPFTQSGAIELQIRSEALTRAVADVDYEAAISHIDVLFFDESDVLYHHERVVTAATFAGKITLSKTRNEFPVNAKYNVYLVANSTLNETTFATLTSIDELFLLTQTDERIHQTGLDADIVGAPSHFLMDGQAYLSSNIAEPATKDAVEINNGVESDDTHLSCTLRRAAVKVVVTLKQGDKVEFKYNYHAGYYFRNMPYNTMVVSEYTHSASLRTPDKTSCEYFNWSSDNTTVTVTGYFYSHDRAGASFFERGTSLIVNIPLSYTAINETTGVEETVDYENCYYQLQLSKTGAFERNHIYYVTATINAPGAEEISEPVMLQDMKYSVVDWVSQSIDVGGEAGPKYLKVNRQQMEMHNVATDAETLVFASSDPVSIDITNVYYIDKFGQTQNITANLSNYNISATPLAELAGNIEVNSDVPVNNTIRYIQMRIYHDDNNNGRHDSGELYEDVLVIQYPVIYVTNIVGWYSYRDDFKTTDSKPTTFQYRGNNIVRVGLDSTNTGSFWNPNYEWTGEYVYNDSDNYFWRSKVADDPQTSGDNVGKSYLYYYSWGNSSAATEAGKTNYGYQNCRMYHVRVTATSADYVVGRPRITDNVTDDGADNAKLVSPSFMIASRLGFVTTGNNIGMVVTDNEDRHQVFADHCREYVEVYKDSNGNPVTFDDWRLPTTAELQIIMDLQGTASRSADAIDYLLNAVFYESASGRTFNTKNDDNVSSATNYSGTSYSVRCVRDAY